MSLLDRSFPPQGPCALCGDRDARHRVWDAIKSRHAAGESPHELAADYGVSTAAIFAVIHCTEVTA